MRQYNLKAYRKRDGYYQDIISRPDLAEYIMQLKISLHKTKLKRHVILDSLQLRLASAQKDLASATARFCVPDQFRADLWHQRAVTAEPMQKLSTQSKELTLYQELFGCLTIKRSRAIRHRDAIRNSVARLESQILFISHSRSTGYDSSCSCWSDRSVRHTRSR